jgi:hypothetical protein
MILAKSAALVLLPIFAMSATQARAQNQTPANVGPVVGGWTDPATGLMWTKQDNGSDVNWNQANAYCANMRLGGYTDWRLPTIDELQDIYDPSVDVTVEGIVHVKGKIRLSAKWEWSSSLKNAGEAWFFYFVGGGRGSNLINDHSYGNHALCVHR